MKITRSRARKPLAEGPIIGVGWRKTVEGIGSFVVSVENPPRDVLSRASFTDVILSAQEAERFVVYFVRTATATPAVGLSPDQHAAASLRAFADLIEARRS